MRTRPILVAGSVLAALAVLAGAFGAHGLHDLLAERGTLDTFETAVRYQMYAALGMLACAALAERGLATGLAAAALGGGAVVFSGSLYALAVTGPRWLGAITPIGGLAIIAGFAVLAWSARRAGPRS